MRLARTAVLSIKILLTITLRIGVAAILEKVKLKSIAMKC
jgi:hypothetical protein